MLGIATGWLRLRVEISGDVLGSGWLLGAVRMKKKLTAPCEMPWIPLPAALGAWQTYWEVLYECVLQVAGGRDRLDQRFFLGELEKITSTVVGEVSCPKDKLGVAPPRLVEWFWT